MKTKLTASLFLLFAFVSCTNIHTVVEEKYKDGTQKRVCVYKGSGENKEIMKESTFYPNKNLQMEGTYRNKKRDGKWIYRYENGSIWSEGFFKDGKSNGKRTTYFENGKVRYEGFYRDDQRMGIWRFYDETGRVVKEVDFSLPPVVTK
jgi:antitoxin component YwqK of YwqJK toxin-antitoxin module